MDDATNLRLVLGRVVVFMNRAGRIILPLMILVWALSTFPYPPQGAAGPAIDYSFAGMIGHWIQPLLAPIGFNWRMSITLILGMAAREVAVATLGTIYSVGDVEGAGGAVLQQIVGKQWSLATGLSFLAWYVFAPQCVATLGVVKRETDGWTWPTVMFVYMATLAYLAALGAYRGAVALGWG